MSEILPPTPNLPRKYQYSQFELSRILVGVTGGSAAGKTTLCETIKKEMQYDNEFDISILSLDSFYKGVDKTKVDISHYNFDHPAALDWDLAFQVISTLLQGNPAQIPVYCFVTHQRLDKYEIVMPSQVIIFEGILALYDERIRNLMQYKIFMHCDDDIRLCRRIIRDVSERGRQVDGVLVQYNRFVKKSFEDFVKPTMSLADIIIPGSRNNDVSVAFIVNHLKNLTKQFGQLKDKMTTILYFGDLLYQVDGLMNKTIKNNAEELLYERKVNKQFIFPTEEITKQDYLHAVHYIINFKLQNQKQLFKVIKQCWKLNFTVLTKALFQEQIEVTKIQVLKLDDIYVNEKIILEDLQQEYILINLPFLFAPGVQFITSLSVALRKQYPKHKFIILNLFSDIKTIVQGQESYKNLKMLLNSFLVGRYDKFLQSICVGQNPTDPNFFYQADKLYQKTLKSFQKLKLKQNL
ncbi:hypothetical protein pb186bvf_006002 [Paramecium bursaria]